MVVKGNPYNKWENPPQSINNIRPSLISPVFHRENPNIEFARLFSIKESLLKADNTLLNINFNKIQILSKQGEISFKSFSISSSITNKYCVSIVMSFNSI